ncbi:uncharacterized protein LOC116187768 [Punica granatum]|uniref:Uncharacterized protein LOC116187768 n=1 Tax=Punica granatum TaxID=22663 RepID=A0A6P8BPB3_PUNGR|nr:uncharacterized protein LOC116187768 [Punica granatum]
MPWVALGDFNEAATSWEKLGGSAASAKHMSLFNRMLDECALLDLGFTGPRFTWSNLWDFDDLIQERLDRVLTNVSWKLQFPEAVVTHLPKSHSDHCPILLSLNPRSIPRLSRSFRFESIWFSHGEFKGMVSHSWEEAQFDHIKAVLVFQGNVSK